MTPEKHGNSKRGIQKSPLKKRKRQEFLRKLVTWGVEKGGQKRMWRGEGKGGREYEGMEWPRWRKEREGEQRK